MEKFVLEFTADGDEDPTFWVIEADRPGTAGRMVDAEFDRLLAEGQDNLINRGHNWVLHPASRDLP